jgi:segregation and condensation protein B
MPAPPDADRAIFDTRYTEDAWTEEGTETETADDAMETDRPAFDAETTVRARDTDGSTQAAASLDTADALTETPAPETDGADEPAPQTDSDGGDDVPREALAPAIDTSDEAASQTDADDGANKPTGALAPVIDAADAPVEAPAPDIDAAGDGHPQADAAGAPVEALSPEIDGAGDLARQADAVDARTDNNTSRSDAPDSRQDDTAATLAEPDPALFAHALRIAEALVFASDRPVTPARLAGALPPGCDARAVLFALAAATAARPAPLVEVAGGFAFRTAADLAPAITRVVEAPRRLPRAAMETLAIVAYHQPVTRAEIEEIRGASLSQSTLELLLDAALIAPRGRKEVPGRPSLWATTPRFLEQFGLKALGDLPRREELVNEPPPLPLEAPSAAPPPPPPEQQEQQAEEEAALLPVMA